MFKRHTLMFLLLVGAAAVPYLSTSSDGLWKNVSSWMPTSSESKKSESTAGSVTTIAPLSGRRGGADATMSGPANVRATPPLEGNSTQDLAEVLRMDATTDWVTRRWPRVTAGLAELDMQGYRVPLVTGTQADDLAGSLTYYFDREQHVAQITFHGTTGDPRKLVGLVTSRYEFIRQPTDDPNLVLYQVKWNGKARSELKLRPARVVRANSPNTHWDVDLVIRR